MTLINLGTATFLRVVVPVCLLSADKTTFPPKRRTLYRISLKFIPFFRVQLKCTPKAERKFYSTEGSMAMRFLIWLL